MTKNHEFFRPDLEAEDTAASTKAIRKDLKRLLSPNSIVVDVGANRGQFAMEVLDVISEVTIYSFEPVREAFNDLKVLASNYKQVIPIQSAVSLKTGKAEFYVTESDVGSSLLEPLPNQPSKWLTLAQKTTVDTIRLDDFICSEGLEDHNRAISLLKTDAQGADLDVIVSAGRFLNSKVINAILVEINFKIFYDSQQPFYEIFAELDRNGYRLAWLYPHRSYDEWLWWADALFISK